MRNKFLYFACLFLSVAFFQLPGNILKSSGFQFTQVPFPASSGVLDSTFASGGVLGTPVGFGNDIAQATAIQPDGKIVVGGYAFNGVSNDFALVRYNPNGTLDPTFGNSGTVMTPVGPGDDEAFGMVLQPDGKILLVGQSSNGTNTDLAAVRYTINGTLDSTFDGDGLVTVGIGTSNELGRTVAVQADGKIVIAGETFNGANFDIAVVRLESNGSLDSSFDGNSGNGNGILVTQVGLGSDRGYAVAIQPNGKIVLAGFFTAALSLDTVLLRYNADGVLDTTFDVDGISIQAFSPTDTDEALAMVLQSDGKIVIAGCYRNGGLNDFLLARFEANGSLDTTFGTGGKTIVQFSLQTDFAFGVAMQSDGKIVAVGFANNGTNNDFGVTRVNSNGTLDTSFDGDGRQLTMIGSSVDSANAVAVQADGKIVVVGRTVVGATSDFGISRYGYGANAVGNDGFFALNATTAIRFENAYQVGTSGAMALDPGLIPAPAGSSFVGSPQDIRTNALFSGDILIQLILPSDIDPASFNAIRIMQSDNAAWVDRTAVSPARDFATKTVYARVASLGVFAAVSPASAVVTVSGRVTTPAGQGLRNAVVSLIDSNNIRRTAVTSSFGQYSFADVRTGLTYTLVGSSRRYRFAVQTVTVTSNLGNVDLIGLE